MKQKNTTARKALIALVIVAIAVISLYFLSGIFFIIGPVLLLIGLVISVYGIKENSKETFAVGAIIFIMGLAMIIFGFIGFGLFKWSFK